MLYLKTIFQKKIKKNKKGKKSNQMTLYPKLISKIKRYNDYFYPIYFYSFLFLVKSNTYLFLLNSNDLSLLYRIKRRGIFIW